MQPEPEEYNRYWYNTFGNLFIDKRPAVDHCLTHKGPCESCPRYKCSLIILREQDSEFHKHISTQETK